MNLDYQNLVRRINEEAHPTPQPHPLGSRMGWAIFWFYVVAVAAVVAFVGGYLEGLEGVK